MKSKIYLSQLTNQNGTVLVVSLLLLLVITLLGIASIQTSTMEMKMSTSAKDRNLAFEGAEAALVAAESDLATNPPQIDALYSTCTGATCFNVSCDNGGLCFDGEYESTDNRFECEVAVNAGSAQRVVYWADTGVNVWQTSAKHRTISVDGLDNTVKYITEFLCFVQDPGSANVFGDPGYENDGVPLFRITALAEGNSGAEVMLQSTYIVMSGF